MQTEKRGNKPKTKIRACAMAIDPTSEKQDHCSDRSQQDTQPTDGSSTSGTEQGGSRLRAPFVIVPDVPVYEEEEPEKERVDAEAASSEVAALLTSPAGVTVLVDTAAKWDGVELISSLEACNGVTKSRGVIFAPQRQSRLHSFSFHLRLKRGAVLGFTPIIAMWDEDVQRATDILYTGPVQKCQSSDFEEILCEVPQDVEIVAGRQQPVVLALWSENVTETRSAGAELAQVLGLVAQPVIQRSVYLNGKMTTGTWRTYESTLVGKFRFTPIEPA